MSTELTVRRRYLETLLFGNPDKIPLSPGHPRRSTRKRWQEEGLPEGMNHMDYVAEKIGVALPVTKPVPAVSVDFRMIPWFEEKVLEHKNGHYIVQDWMGNITEISDVYDYTYIRSAIDFVTRRWLDAPVHNAQDWEQMKQRYNSAAPERVPTLTKEEQALLAARDSVLSLNMNGPFWQLREWMGFEELCIAFLERPDFVREMIAFWQEHTLAVLRRCFAGGIIPDRIGISEDMAYKAHSMISPAMTREFLLPVYRAWMQLFREYQIPLVDMDSDGYIADLIPIWIEAGFNVCDPIEVAAGNDIVRYREQFGNSIAYVGAIDKRAIAAGGATLRRELERVLPPLLRTGGFLPGCDHGVPSDISLQNYVEYTDLLARYCGWK